MVTCRLLEVMVLGMFGHLKLIGLLSSRVWQVATLKSGTMAKTLFWALQNAHRSNLVLNGCWIKLMRDGSD